jgi:hypothetical protein
MISEKLLEDIICKYPDLIENDLKLLERQITLYGRRMDLVFQDKFNRKLINELKAGPIKDGHIGQILSYEGMLLSADDPTLRVMLVGTRVPPNIQKSLDHHGIAWKEIPISKLIEFLNGVGDKKLLECLPSEDLSNQLHNQIAKDRTKSTIKERRSDRRRQIGAAATFEDLCNIIRDLSLTIPTNYMDLLLLENEDKPLSAILIQWQNYEGKNMAFEAISVIKAHIKYREDHDGWIFSRWGNAKDPIVKLTGLTAAPRNSDRSPTRL